MVLMLPSEKRKLERFNLEVLAKIEVLTTGHGKEKLDFQTSNVCSGGAYLLTPQPLPVGTEISVDLVLPLDEFKKLPNKYEKVQINLTGKVLRVEPDGMGVCFDENYQIRPWKEEAGFRA